jgi:hypothetical protein
VIGPDREWWSQARCRDYPDWPWIADQIESLALGVMVEVCRACPVVIGCRAYTADLEARGVDLVGVWGGEVRMEGRRLVGAGV